MGEGRRGRRGREGSRIKCIIPSECLPWPVIVAQQLEVLDKLVLEADTSRSVPVRYSKHCI